MDENRRRLLLVDDKGGYSGLISSGDLQRAIIANLPMDTPIGSILRKDIRVAHETDTFEKIKKLMIELRTEFMPVVDDSGNLIKVYFWEDIFPSTERIMGQVIAPVVVMAGGKGTRLKPFSNVLPKPLFPMGEKTILETIFDRFEDNGCKEFILSVNYKADFIRSYVDSIEGRSYEVDFVQEREFLGTAGSLRLLLGKVKETFFVSNCDIVIDADYSEIMDYHRTEKNEITLVAAFKHLKIPYGTVTSGERGQLLDFREKPELDFLINSGLYILESDVLGEIPEGQFFHITDLIEQVRHRGGRVGVYPVSANSWCDIGEWHEYKRTLDLLGLK